VSGHTFPLSIHAHLLFSDNASPDDPSEISFAKGEMLDITDKTGKWWAARKEDGSTGSAYLRSDLIFRSLTYTII
jgi:hypothetical protein